MKMVKSLLLGSAAGLVAVAGAQAADLPVKAKAVEYVKICSLYGAGFYYIPGTNTCLGISGFMRSQSSHWDGGSGAATQSGTASVFSAPNGGDLRVNTGQGYSFRVRTMLTFDARTQSAYGTLRSVSTVGYTNDLNSAVAGTSIYANRGFIQIAGFTLGKATSYFDFYSAPASSYNATVTGDTGDGGWIVAAYTAQFGGGMSATIAAEEPRRTQIVNVGTPGVSLLTLLTTGGVTYTNAPVQQRAPDAVANLRWDQNWGSFQIMGALHDAGGGYYTGPGAIASVNGHPGDKLGWAAGAGLRLRPGADVLDVQATYSQGATRYHMHAQATTSLYQFSSSSVGWGIVSDGGYGDGSSIELTTVWSVNASYDHRWSPALKTSIYGSYMANRYNATANAALCNNEGVGGGVGYITAGSVGCNNNWQLWYIGSRTQWDVTKGLYMGFDVLYQKLETASKGLATFGGYAPGGGRATGVYTFADQENWSVTFRAHRDFP
jgi:hypothetical protein